jgi:hypothetical protein
MLLAQRQGLGVERVVGRTPRARPVAGFQTRRGLTELLEQLPDGTWAEVQGLGDGGGGLPPVGAAQEKAAQGQRQGCRHGDPRQKNSGPVIAYARAAARQNLYVGINGVTYCRATAPRSPGG